MVTDKVLWNIGHGCLIVQPELKNEAQKNGSLRAALMRDMRADFNPALADLNLRPNLRTYLKPEVDDLRPERSHLRPESTDARPESSDLRPEMFSMPFRSGSFIYSFIPSIWSFIQPLIAR